MPYRPDGAAGSLARFVDSHLAMQAQSAVCVVVASDHGGTEGEGADGATVVEVDTAGGAKAVVTLVVTGANEGSRVRGRPDPLVSDSPCLTAEWPRPCTAGVRGKIE